MLNNINNGTTGSLQTDAFIINVLDDSGALTIEITDRATGEISEVLVNGLNP
ncbi:curli assembly protein CsgF [compost metagenome]